MSGWNTTMSSSRLMNSGLNAWRTSSCTASSFCSHGERSGRSRYCDAEVRREDEDHVAEVDRAPLAVGEPTVVEHLQQNVEDLGMRLLDLVEQHHRVRPAAHGLGQLPALLVADVPGRGTDQPRHGVLLAVLATCRCARAPSRRRTGTRRAPSRARSCRRRSGRGTGTSRSAGRGRRCPPACGAPPRRRRRRRLLADQPLAELGLEVQQLLGLALGAAGRPGCPSTRRRRRRCPRR